MRTVFAGAAMAACFALPVAAQDDAVTAETVLATVNGTDITIGHLITMRELLPPQFQELPAEVLFDGMLEQLIQQEVIAAVAAEDPSTRMRLGLENERRAFLATRYLDDIGGGEITEEEIQAEYDAQFAAAEPVTEYNASHILVETEEAALALIEALGEGADFAELARENSTGPSGPNGGALGWFTAGMMVAPFEQAVFELDPGEVSPPVQTQFGWHVVLLNETRDQAPPALEQVRTELVEGLRRARVDAQIDALLSDAEIELTDMEIDASIITDGTLIDD